MNDRRGLRQLQETGMYILTPLFLPSTRSLHWPGDEPVSSRTARTSGEYWMYRILLSSLYLLLYSLLETMNGPCFSACEYEDVFPPHRYLSLEAY